MDWPSIWFPSETSCNPCRATSGRDDVFSVYVRYGDREAFLSIKNKAADNLFTFSRTLYITTGLLLNASIFIMLLESRSRLGSYQNDIEFNCQLIL